MTEHPHDPTCTACGDDDGIAVVMPRLDAMIAASGHAVLAIDHEDTRIAYTVGLAEMGWPELVITGLPYETALDLLNAAVKVMRMRERPAEPGQVIEKAANLPLRVKALDVPPQTVLKGAAARLRSLGLDPAGMGANQLTWPDPQGVHPDQADYDTRYAQQILI